MPGLTGFEVARRLLDARRGVAHRLRHRVRSARDRGVRGQRGRLPAEAGRSGAARGRRRARAAAHRARTAGRRRRPARRRQQRRSSRRSSSWSPNGRAGASGSRSRSASGSCSCRPTRSSTRRWPTKSSRSSRASTSGTSNYRTLDELQARLDPSVFWRVHRSHLVNINKIKEIVPWFSRNYILRMKDEKATEIPVSRTQTRRLREYLKL